MSKVVLCQFQEDAKCSFKEKFGDDGPHDVDCLLCLSATFKQIARDYSIIIASSGAGRFAKEFLWYYLELWKGSLLMDRILKKVRPERWEQEQEIMKKSGAPVIVAPLEIIKMIKDYEKRGKVGRI